MHALSAASDATAWMLVVKSAAHNNQPAKLSKAQAAEYCTRFLEWGKNYLRKHLGSEAAEYAGQGIFEATRTWDGRVPFMSWASVVLKRVAIAAMREQYGVPGSLKHTARSRTYSIIENADTMTCEPTANAERRIIHAEWVDEAFKQVDQLAGKERLAKLCETMGLYPPKVSGSIAHSAGVIFEDFSHVIDAMMLGGATISDRENAPRIAIKRWRNSWTIMPWLAAAVEQNCPSLRLHIVSSPATVGRYITLKTRNMAILAASARRWYPTQSCRTPADITLTPGALAFWLADAMVKSTADQPLSLTAPGLTEKAARNLRRQLQPFGLDDAVKIVRRGRSTKSRKAPSQHRLEAPIEHRKRFAHWLEQTVPRCAWEPDTRWQTQTTN